MAELTAIPARSLARSTNESIRRGAAAGGGAHNQTADVATGGDCSGDQQRHREKNEDKQRTVAIIKTKIESSLIVTETKGAS